MYWIYFLVCIVITDGAKLHLHETTIGPITEEDVDFITMSLENDKENPWNGAQVKIISLTPTQVSVENETIYISKDEIDSRQNVSVMIHALVLGHGRILIEITGISSTKNDTQFLDAIVKVRVARKERVIDTIFLIGIAVFMTINNVNMGCVIDMGVVREVFRRPIGPIVGFFSQFLFMPLASYGFAHAFFTSSSTRLGLFALGCCPGGTGSNFWTLLLGGDLNLSVVMTFVSTVAALGMMPLWLFTLGAEFFEDIQIPYSNLFTTLLSLIVPVGAGVLIRHFRPQWAKWSEKIIRPYTVVLLIFFMTIGIYCNLFLLKLFTWQVVMAGVCVAWGGYIFGALAAWFLCMKKEQIIAISIETALQNPGIAFLVLKLSLPPPDADLASVSPVAQLFVTGIPLWIGYIIVCTQKRMSAAPNLSKKNSFRKMFKKKRLNETDVEEIEVEKKPQSPDLWISVPIREEDEQMIRSVGDGEEDVVWQR